MKSALLQLIPRQRQPKISPTPAPGQRQPSPASAQNQRSSAAASAQQQQHQRQPSASEARISVYYLIKRSKLSQFSLPAGSLTGGGNWTPLERPGKKSESSLS